MSTSNSTLIQNATILTMDPQVPDLEKGDLLIVDGRIKEIGASLKPADANSIVIDGTDRIVIPGFVDCHRHSWEAVLRFIHPDSSTFGDYLEVTNDGLCPLFRPQDVYAGTYATAMAALDAGITTVIDNMHCNNTPDHGKASIRAWEDAGAEAVVALNIGDVSSTSHDDVPKPEEELVQFMQDFQGSISVGARGRVSVAIWDPRYGDAAFRVAKRLGIRLVGEYLGMQNQSMLDEPYKSGLLGPHVTINHCTQNSEGFWDKVKATDVRINICPRSDAQWSLSGGVCAYQMAIDRGIRPGISIDNEIAYGGDMFSEMRSLFTLQRALAASSGTGEPMSVRDLLRAATIDGARNTGREAEIGSLTPGKLANLVIIRGDDVNLYPAHTAAGTVALAADRSNVDTVMVQGKIVKKDGRLVGFDAVKYREMIDESVGYLKKAGGYQGRKVTETFALQKK